MDFRYASVIKTFRTIRDFKPDNDPTLTVDTLLDSPASLINDYSLQKYDDEIAAAVVHADTHKVVRSYDDDYSDEDFIDPNAKKEAELSEDVLSEIELKFGDINKKLKIILESLDLRLYEDNRPALKKSLYADLFNNYFAEYEYITQDIRIRLSSIISAAVDKAFREVSLSAKQRASSLFEQLLSVSGQYIDEHFAATANHSDKFADALYKDVERNFIEPMRQSAHYSFEEYQIMCRMMKKYIEKKCDAH
jgi:hypothetical protein